MGVFERVGKEPDAPAPADNQKNAETVTQDSGGLGPAFTSDFPPAAGFDGLLAGGTKAPSTGTAAPGVSAQGMPASPAPLDPKVVEQYLIQLDAIVSALSDLTPEQPDVMIGISRGMYPLINYYASGQSSVAVMWFVASTSVLAYVGLKYKQLQLRAATEEQTSKVRPDNASKDSH